MCVFLNTFYRNQLFHPLASSPYLLIGNVAVVHILLLLFHILIIVTVVNQWPDHFGTEHAQLKIKEFQ